MSRYEQVLKHNYDIPLNCSEPVQVAASALLRDTVTLNYFAQIKLKNVSEFSVEKVSVIVVPYDANQTKIGNEIIHTYDGLNVPSNEHFGSKEAIAFSNIKDVSSFQVTVKDVVFANGLEWVFGQTMEDVKSEKNSEVLEQVETYIGRGDYNKAIGFVDNLFDTEINKTKIRNDLYARFMSIAEGKITEEDISAAEKALGIVPSGFEGKKDAVEHLNTAKKGAYEKNQAHKNKVKKISAIAIAIVIVVVAAGLLATKVIIPNSHYNAAVELYEEGSYEEAIESFQALDGYKDSNDLIEKCEKAILEKDNEEKYSEAIKSYKSGDYDNAFSLLESIEGYKDATELQERYHKELRGKAVSFAGEKIADEVNSLEVGDEFKFGEYVTKKDSDKKEPIEWVVNYKGGGGYEVLLTSKYILTYKHFCDSKNAEATWEKSSLRKWLNEDFLTNAFSESEQKLITASNVPGELNESYPTVLPGNDTKDKVYILSASEVLNYFHHPDSDPSVITWNEETSYAKSVLNDLGDKIDEDDINTDADYEQEYSVWLRNPGQDDKSVEYYQNLYGKNSTGFLWEAGRNAYSDVCGVRPTIRINLLR